jgi:hypothetical protein
MVKSFKEKLLAILPAVFANFKFSFSLILFHPASDTCQYECHAEEDDAQVE